MSYVFDGIHDKAHYKDVTLMGDSVVMHATMHQLSNQKTTNCNQHWKEANSTCGLHVQCHLFFHHVEAHCKDSSLTGDSVILHAIMHQLSNHISPAPFIECCYK